MAVTRHATGNSKPRQFEVVSTEAPTKKRSTGTKKKAVTNKTATGRVAKKEPTTTHKRKPSVGDKVKGAIKKVEGAIEKKPGKKAAGTAEMRGHDGKKKTTSTKKATSSKKAAPKKTEVDVKVKA